MLKTSFKSKKGTAHNQSKFFLTLRKTFFWNWKKYQPDKTEKIQRREGGILYCRVRQISEVTDSRKEKVMEGIVRV